MATSFLDIRSLIRPLVDDTDDSSYAYSSDLLDGHIKAVFLTVDGTLNLNNSVPVSGFLEDLPFKTQMRIAIAAAKTLLSLMPKEFSHKSPIQSVTRKWDKAFMLSSLSNIERKIEGSTVVTSDEYEKLLNLPWLHSEKLTESLR